MNVLNTTAMISIVLPAFNEEKYIRQCLTSLQRQDYKGEYEIIVVDNCSADRTASISRELGARVVCCESKGAFSARQAGAFAARGDIIVQADADTVYPGNWLSRLIEQFNSHPEAVAIGGRFIYLSPEPWWAPVEYGIRAVLNVLGMLIMRRPVMISGANFAFRREAFLKIGGYNVTAYSPDQYNISSRLSKIGKVIVDSTLKVQTSPRRVEGKSFIRLIGECLLNIFSSLRYFFPVFRETFRVNFETKRAFRITMSLLPLIIVLGYLAHGYYLPNSQVFGDVYYKGSESEMNIALTFDDGPNDPYTTDVLDILDSYGVKATFFLVGMNVMLYPDTVKRMVSGGHNIGNHSFTHNANHAIIAGTCSEICKTQEAIKAVAGVSPHFYRPPHGKKSPWELQCLQENGLMEITWSVATEDQRVGSPETLARNMVANARPGGIILMHDGYGTMHDCPRANKSFTVKALPIIIEELTKQGYRFVTVSELFGVPAYN